MTTDKTGNKQATDCRFKPGKSGNPKGRPKGARSKMSETFLLAMKEDFEEHGIEAIREVRKERPYDYLKLIASLLPKNFAILPETPDAEDEEPVSAIDELFERFAREEEENASKKPLPS